MIVPDFSREKPTRLEWMSTGHAVPDFKEALWSLCRVFAEDLSSAKIVELMMNQVKELRSGEME